MLGSADGGGVVHGCTLAMGAVSSSVRCGQACVQRMAARLALRSSNNVRRGRP
jgi:hypothetical protein